MINDLISREAAKEAVKYIPWYDWSAVGRTLDELPSVDAAPVVHGRWIDNGIPESMLSGCSVCGFSCGAYTFNYCPNCGAKMDKEE